jgi:CRP-like cAMP-binding protein
MSADKLFHVLSSIHPLSSPFKNAIEKELTLVAFPKNYLLLEAPKIADHIYFLNHGFAMCYTYDRGIKQVEGFWKAQQLIVSPKSFFEQIPAKEFIQLMQQSDVLCMSQAALLRLFDTFSEAHIIYRVLMNRHYECSRQRIRDLQNLNAVERHEKLLSVFSNIEQIIPQEQIASYLGITPQSLSRIKRQRNSY